MNLRDHILKPPICTGEIHWRLMVYSRSSICRSTHIIHTKSIVTCGNEGARRGRVDSPTLNVSMWYLVTQRDGMPQTGSVTSNAPVTLKIKDSRDWLTEMESSSQMVDTHMLTRKGYRRSVTTIPKLSGCIGKDEWCLCRLVNDDGRHAAKGINGGLELWQRHKPSRRALCPGCSGVGKESALRVGLRHWSPRNFNLELDFGPVDIALS